MRAAAAAVAAVIAAGPAAAEETSPFHFQATVATQAHPAFDAPYSGKNSLRSGKESATSVVMDLLAIFHPWSGGEITIQPS